MKKLIFLIFILLLPFKLFAGELDGKGVICSCDRNSLPEDTAYFAYCDTGINYRDEGYFFKEGKVYWHLFREENGKLESGYVVSSEYSIRISKVKDLNSIRWDHMSISAMFELFRNSLILYRTSHSSPYFKVRSCVVKNNQQEFLKAINLLTLKYKKEIDDMQKGNKF